MSTAAAIWHEVENGAYGDDLPLWEELAAEAGSPVMDIGCGTGRVALHLARRGFEVLAIDMDAELLAALRDKAAAERLAVSTEAADVRKLDGHEGEFPLVLAPMQLVQLLGGPTARVTALGRIRRTLQPGGLVAVAIVEGAGETVGEAEPPSPDMRESDGWLHSSLPLDVTERDGRLEVRRLRQLVAPWGTLTEAEHVDRLDMTDADSLEDEMLEAGLEPVARRATPPSERYIDTVTVIARRET